MTALEALRRARAKIAEPERWTQRFWARDAKGNDIHPRDPNAVCWCPMGALEAVTLDVAPAARLLACVFVDRGDITFWNDARYRTHAEVLELFDRAIEIAQDAEIRGSFQ